MKIYSGSKCVIALLSFFLPWVSGICQKVHSTKPNIVIIYTDDLGYGDIGAYGASAVKTPNLDQLAKDGIIFTDAHSSAATCTPSRYSLLTGSYAFRNNVRILSGDAPLIINDSTRTLGNILQDAGYRTGIVGKWHLGLGNGNIDWNQRISPGPLERGFDYSFIIAATGDRVPCVFVENHDVVNLNPKDPIQVNYEKPFRDLPTGLTHPHLLRMGADVQHANSIVNGISRIGFMKGGNSALWQDEHFSEIFLERANRFIDESLPLPFFLYLALHDIHVPRLPHNKFVRSTNLGPRGDAIVQMDWLVGEMIKTLNARGILENTLIIFTSDNGPVLNDGYDDRADQTLSLHNPAGPFRGGKYSVLEAGTRVPLIVNWPQKVKPGIANSLMSQIDLYASLASLCNIELKDGEAPDSQNLIDTWLGRSDKGRELLIEEGVVLALRNKQWKYIPPSNLIDWPWIQKGIESGISKEPQLYNLEVDFSEQNNVYMANRAFAQSMEEALNQLQQKRSTR